MQEDRLICKLNELFVIRRKYDGKTDIILFKTEKNGGAEEIARGGLENDDLFGDTEFCSYDLLQFDLGFSQDRKSFEFSMSGEIPIMKALLQMFIGKTKDEK